MKFWILILKSDKFRLQKLNEWHNLPRNFVLKSNLRRIKQWEIYSYISFNLRPRSYVSLSESDDWMQCNTYGYVQKKKEWLTKKKKSSTNFATILLVLRLHSCILRGKICVLHLKKKYLQKWRDFVFDIWIENQHL